MRSACADDRTELGSRLPFTIPPTKLIHVDIDPEEIGRNYPVALGLMADVRTFLRQVLAELETRKASPMPLRRAEMAGTIDGYRQEWNKFIAPGSSTTQRRSIRARCRRIDKALPDDHHGQRHGVHHNWCCSSASQRPDSFIGCMGFAMGFGVAGAGRCLPRPTGPASVCGDGAFFMHANVLACGRIQSAVVGGGTIRLCVDPRLQRGYLTAASLPPTSIIPRPASPTTRTAAMARSTGVEGVRVDRAGDISNAIRWPSPPRRT